MTYFESMNKLEEIEMLAIFMGHDGQHEEWCGNNILIDDHFSETGKGMCAYNPDTNWNQLMEIVGKINVVIKDEILADFDYDVFISMQQWILDVSIGNAYNDAVTIVKWYSNKK